MDFFFYIFIAPRVRCGGTLESVAAHNEDAQGRDTAVGLSGDYSCCRSILSQSIQPARSIYATGMKVC